MATPRKTIGIPATALETVPGIFLSPLHPYWKIPPLPSPTSTSTVLDTLPTRLPSLSDVVKLLPRRTQRRLLDGLEQISTDDKLFNALRSKRSFILHPMVACTLFRHPRLGPQHRKRNLIPRIRPGRWPSGFPQLHPERTRRLCFCSYLPNFVGIQALGISPPLFLSMVHRQSIRD